MQPVWTRFTVIDTELILRSIGCGKPECKRVLLTRAENSAKNIPLVCERAQCMTAAPSPGTGLFLSRKREARGVYDPFGWVIQAFPEPTLQCPIPSPRAPWFESKSTHNLTSSSGWHSHSFNARVRHGSNVSCGRAAICDCVPMAVRTGCFRNPVRSLRSFIVNTATQKA
jgi:hypothetical protein